MKDIRLFNYEKLKRNIKLSLESLEVEYEMFNEEQDKDKIESVIKEFKDIEEEISIMIRYEIDDDPELADSVIVICNRYIKALIDQFRKDHKEHIE